MDNFELKSIISFFLALLIAIFLADVPARAPAMPTITRLNDLVATPFQSLIPNLINFIPSSSSVPTPPCEEPDDAVVTPCNRDVLRLIAGNDLELQLHSGPPDFLPRTNFLRSILSAVGYYTSTIDCSGKEQFADLCRPQNLVSYLKSSRVVLVDSHGAWNLYGGLACHNDVDWGSNIDGVNPCCQRLKEWAQALGVRDTLDCSQRPGSHGLGDFYQTPIRSMSTGEGTLRAVDSGSRGCATASNPRPHTCEILFDTQALGNKALIVSGQCYGGACSPSSGEYINMTPIGDIHFGRTYPSIVNHDLSLLAQDISGQSVERLIGVTIGPENPRAPFFVGTGDVLRGLDFRNVRGSAGLAGGRGRVDDDPDNSGLYNLPAYFRLGEEYFDLTTGDRKYYAARGILSRNETTDQTLEFIPTYSTIDYQAQTGQLAINFTSALKPESVTRPSISSPVPRAYSSLSSVEASGPRYTSNPHQIQANLTRLNGATPVYHLMTKEKWDSPDFETKYGHSRADWPYYTLVVFRGLTAPNGIKLAGNVSAELTDAELNNLPLWIWADQEHTLSFPSMDWCGDDGIPCGKAKYVGEVKGGTIAFKLPLQPHYSCCFQNTVTVAGESSHCINVDSHNLGTGISSTCRILTGPDANQVGTPHLWATCLNGEEYLTRMCPSGLPQGVSTFKAWPLDDGQPARDCWAGDCDSLTWIPDDPGAYQCPSYTEVMPTAGQGLGWPMCNGNQATASCVAGSNWCWATDHANCQLMLKDCRSALVPSTRPAGLQPVGSGFQPGSTIQPKVNGSLKKLSN